MSPEQKPDPRPGVTERILTGPKDAPPPKEEKPADDKPEQKPGSSKQ